MESELERFLLGRPKYKLVFDTSSSLILKTADIGFLLAQTLSNKLNKNLRMYASDAIRSIIRDNIYNHNTYGRVLAITNIGILFEPALSVNLETIIEQTSKDVLLVIQANGKIENERFYFLSSQEGFSVSLKNLSYLILK